MSSFYQEEGAQMQTELCEIMAEYEESKRRDTEYHAEWYGKPEKEEAPADSREHAPKTDTATVLEKPSKEKVKIKEQEKVVVPPYPNAVTLYTWKTNLTRAVIVASGNSDYQRVTDWIQQPWRIDTMEDLDSPGDDVFVMLDFKLADGMVHMLNKGGEKVKTHS